ncbi:UDP-3-O-(3-hydroxymyristoyl)glucosamine N-acyltransferase [candidate division NPL-UPA2 bacterium]|nr:UDP-3-O-(3-hydroxymyristoyl)glucosamine N-acyltransferase [candidate division NPL-UPA2 bacterium]
MLMSLREIAELVDGKVIGDSNVMITGVAGIKEAKEGDITFVANSRYASLMNTTQASAIIVGPGVKNNHRPLIQSDEPYLAFTKVMNLLVNGNGEMTPPAGIHPTVVLGKNVELGTGVSLQPYVIIEDDVQIGDRVTIYPHVYIGRRTRIGDETLIYPGVSIREKIEIGKRVIIHSGTVVGSDGFGFAPVKGVHHKVPQIGTVIVEDDVEIGANVAIDRGTIGKTVIGRGTKIDNLVQIAHNVVIGENSIIVAQVGISGTATLGKGVTLAGQSGVGGHITVGDNTIVAARAGVTKSIPPDSFVSGFPAKPHEKEKRIKASLQRLPEMCKAIGQLAKKVKRLEEKLKQ